MFVLAQQNFTIQNMQLVIMQICSTQNDLLIACTTMVSTLSGLNLSLYRDRLKQADYTINKYSSQPTHLCARPKDITFISSSGSPVMRLLRCSRIHLINSLTALLCKQLTSNFS